MNHFFVAILSLICIMACNAQTKTNVQQSKSMSSTEPHKKADYDTTQWRELTLENGYFIDIKYATTDNFVKEAVYPCARLFLRRDVADALDRVRDRVKTNSCRLKLFDGYRPRPVQYKLWKKVPNPDYVANPDEGSMHNRGSAIDLTLTDLYGKELDLGTPYDFFGPEAHQDYTNLSKMILSRRQLLKSAMEAEGFQSIRTEWWHFSYTKTSYPLEDWQWSCKN
jgi:D-alanyl-D-alanine dipeptidase